MNTIKLICYNGAELPQKGTELAGAYDLKARGIIQLFKPNNEKLTEDLLDILNKEVFEDNLPVILSSRERILIDTGLQVADLPKGFRGDVKSRSGLALKHGVIVLNGDGLIDEDYRGTLGVILYNTSDKPFEIRLDDRIAQFEPRIGQDFKILQVEEVTEPNSERKGGFGSTGVS